MEDNKNNEDLNAGKDNKPEDNNNTPVTYTEDELAKKIGSTRLSFGSADRLYKYLKLENGYVSPFGVINDESKSVIFIFDKDVQNQTKVGFHPNTNKATIYLNFKDVKKIIEDHGNDVVFVRL